VSVLLALRMHQNTLQLFQGGQVPPLSMLAGAHVYCAKIAFALCQRLSRYRPSPTVGLYLSISWAWSGSL